MADGFLGRWAKRKEAVRKGEEVAPEPPQELAGRVPPPQPSPGRGGSSDPFPPPLGEGEGGGAPAQAPPPTLADTESLTPTSDFTRFVRPGVAPEVKNAALKKLFADPHFNVMDGLDVYIDDYSKPDPIPPEMLRQLTSARFLGMFREEEEAAAKAAEAAGASVNPDDPAPESVAQSGTGAAQALPPAEHHGDPDLRLQQDDAPGPDGPGERPL
jgi:hypothetical protein